MTGSVLDGEDVVQETLAHAFFKLETLEDELRLEAWLFRIAHNRSIDFLRKRRVIQVPFEEEHGGVHEPEDRVEAGQEVGLAITTLVTHLPPMERACVILKDVLDYSLKDVAEIVDSTVGGVKAALHRGREKLRAAPPARRPVSLESFENMLLQEYVDRFNRQDWDGVLDLVRSDARLELVGFGEGKFGRPPEGDYFGNYAALPWRWKFELAIVDDQPMAVHFKEVSGEWQPHSALRVRWEDGKVAEIRDYVHVDYLFENSAIEPLVAETADL